LISGVILSTAAPTTTAQVISQGFYIFRFLPLRILQEICGNDFYFNGFEF